MGLNLLLDRVNLIVLLLQSRRKFVQLLLITGRHLFGLEVADCFFVVLNLAIGVLEFAFDAFELFRVLLADLWTVMNGFLWNAKLLFLQAFGELIILEFQLFQEMFVYICQFAYFSVSENKKNLTFPFLRRKALQVWPWSFKVMSFRASASPVHLQCP